MLVVLPGEPYLQKNAGGAETHSKTPTKSQGQDKVRCKVGSSRILSLRTEDPEIIPRSILSQDIEGLEIIPGNILSQD